MNCKRIVAEAWLINIVAESWNEQKRAGKIPKIKH